METKMMKAFEKNLNCSQSVFRTVCENCGIDADEKMLDMLNGISSGFGINGICSAVVGGLCALGCVFDEEEMKTIRLMFFMDFNERFLSLNCGTIWSSDEECGDIMDFVQKWAEEKIKEKNNASL